MYSLFINKLSCNCYAYALDEELKHLEKRRKILGEKVAIQELKNENAAKKETISQLESKIGLLETQLEKLSTVSPFKKEDATTNENTERQEDMKETGDASEAEQEKDEDTITVMALDNEEIIEKVEAEQEKKNHEIVY
jgi:hypothetical protein